MKKILVPCDFSLSAVEAFKFAVEIAKKSQGEILLLHVLELPVTQNSRAIREFEQAYMKNASGNAERHFLKMKRQWALPVAKIKTLIECGSLQAVIQKVIGKNKIDLVVAGTNGAAGLKEYTIGSNAEKLVRRSTIPVISVRKAPKRVKNIVFPTRPEIGLEELTLKVKALQNFFDATLHVLFVNTPGRFQRDQETSKSLESFAKRFMLKNYTLNIRNDIDEEEGIKNFVSEINADLVAMRTHGRRGIMRLSMFSVAEDVVNHIGCPIWTFKIK